MREVVGGRERRQETEARIMISLGSDRAAAVVEASSIQISRSLSAVHRETRWRWQVSERYFLL
jgi:hypothetical protein